MRVLALTNGWPTERFPEYCVFNRRQVDDIRALGVEVDVAFVNARERGKWAYAERLARIGREAEPYDLVHCFHGLSLLLAVAGRARKPLVVSFLNAIDNEYVDLPAWARGPAARLTRRLVSGGGPTRRGVIVKDRLPPELADNPLARYIPNGIDTGLFRPGDRRAARARLGIDPEAVCLLFVSSKDIGRPQKRHDRFESVVAAYRAAHPGTRVEAVTLVSAPEDVVLATYRAVDVHVMTSDFEGSPNSVKEAMACGLPVVSTDVGNVARMADGLEACRVLVGFDPAAFVAAIDAVLAAPPAARDALRAAIVAQGLDAGTAARKVVDLYESVSGQARG
jgi:glycosyltransferase involved in cell wall biosynthesis